MVNQALEGRTYESAPFEVSAVKIREFARATRATHPAHYDKTAARELGAQDVVAPLTFAVSVAQEAEAKYLADPDSGVDYARVVHGGEELEFLAPVVAGDVLIARHTVTSIVDKGKMVIIVGRAEVTNDKDELVVRAISTIIQRGA